MKIISKTLKILPLLLFVFTLQSCSDDDDNNPIIVPTQLNIVETAQATPALASLVAAIQAADGDLGTVLSGNGPFTVLAPTNDAFDTFLAGTPLDQVPTAQLEQILRNHVIPGEVTAATLSSLSGTDGRGYAQTLAAGFGGENVSILFDTNGALPRFNNVSNVASADLANISASNGIVHVIDAVIPIPTVVDQIVNNESLSTLETLLIDENLVGAAQGNGPFTVFAPNNEAFNTFLANPSGNAVPSILANHVNNEIAAFSEGLNSQYINTLATNADGDALSMFVNTMEGVVLNGVSTVVQADVVGTNGVVHIVDTVIDLPTIVTHAVANPLFDTLQAALTDLTPDTDYVSILSSNGGANDPFTVFAPTNEAFGDLLDDLSLMSATEIPTATLEATLNLHVLLNQNVRAGDLGGIDGAMVPTFGGPSITIDAGTPAIIDPDGGSNPIIATDVQAVNGVIHGISRVIRDL